MKIEEQSRLPVSQKDVAVDAMPPKSQRDRAECLKAAREFEQIFLRKMLSSLEKTGHHEDGPLSAGGGIYSSMVVGALADAVSSAGGIGLADLIVRAASSAPAAAEQPSTGPAAPTSSLPSAAKVAGYSEEIVDSEYLLAKKNLKDSGGRPF